MGLPSSERIAIARDLHDGIAQDLVGIGYSLDLALAEPQLTNQARSQLRDTRLQVDELIAKVRREIFSLRTTDEKSISAGIESAAHHFLNDINFELRLEEVALTQEIATQLLAITTELLRNIATHARATHVEISLYPVNNRICLEISDDGIGGAQMKQGHFGLQGIVERVESVGGSITIENMNGTHVALLL